jgi:hypothetical protein
MIAWLVGKIRWLMLVAAVGGPVMAYLGWSEAARIKDVEQQGVEATAVIDGATRRKGRRSGTSYSVDLAWKDAKGVAQKVEKISISQSFAGQIIRDDKIVRNTVKIKYLPDALDSKPVIIEDAQRQEESDTFMMQAGLGVGALGIVGSLLMLLFRRRAAAQA